MTAKPSRTGLRSRLAALLRDTAGVSAVEFSLLTPVIVVGTLMTQLKALRPNDRPPKLVLNQIGMRRRQEASAKDVQSVLKVSPIVGIPFEPKSFSRAEATGKMVAELGRSALTKAFDVIADEIAPPHKTIVKPKGLKRIA